jgi:hypothetical protein
MKSGFRPEAEGQEYNLYSFPEVFHEGYEKNFVKPQVKTGQIAALIIEVAFRFLPDEGEASAHSWQIQSGTA